MSDLWRAYIVKAHHSLDEARAVAEIKLFEAAGRAAYLAAGAFVAALVAWSANYFSAIHRFVQS